jgi:hypothetical protein
MTRCLLRAATVLVVVCSSTSVLAQPAQQPHTGLYIRLAVGGGGFTDSFRLEALNLGYDGQATGGTFATELGVGGSLKPGLILGGALYGESMVNPKVTVAGYAQASTVSVGTLGMIGPFLEWYPNPQRRRVGAGCDGPVHRRGPYRRHGAPRRGRRVGDGDADVQLIRGVWTVSPHSVDSPSTRAPSARPDPPA